MSGMTRETLGKLGILIDKFCSDDTTTQEFIEGIKSLIDAELRRAREEAVEECAKWIESNAQYEAQITSGRFTFCYSYAAELRRLSRTGEGEAQHKCNPDYLGGGGHFDPIG